MKIKYKLVVIFIFIILAASLPLSLFILRKQEADRMRLIVRQGEVNSRVLARAVLNILLMNGGEVPASGIDSSEMLSVLSPLAGDGLVYADAVLVSRDPRNNGLVIAAYRGGPSSDRPLDGGRLAPREIEELSRGFLLKERPFEKEEGVFYQFSAPAALSGDSPLCVARLVFSKEGVLAPVRGLRWIIYAATGSAIFLVSLLGLFLSRQFSRPISDLVSDMERIGSGDLDYRIPVRTRDEFSKLATTFNHLAQVIRLEIDELATANRELIRLDSIKDEFLANMSHEFRSPLYGMIGLAESLVEGAGGPMNREAVHDLALIIKSGRRLTGLVNDILDFSRLKNRDISLERTVVDLHAAADLVLSLSRPLAARKGLVLGNEVAEGTFVFADENRLQQILVNLVGNALKFTSEGGITVAAGTRGAPEGMIAVSVTDTGIGVPPDKVQRVFETFEQADGSTSRAYGGTGLGLAITKNLVELHGGQIGVQPAPEGGSRFHFTLPLAPEGEAAVPSGVSLPAAVEAVTGLDEIRPAPGPVSRAALVLVVDDEPVNLQVLINHLSLEGYGVVTAASGPEALKRIDEGMGPDLVLLDIMLPGMSGYEVCRVIRERHSPQDLPVLMLTAKNRPGDIVTGLEAGANDYLAKPIDRQELLARVRSLISLKDSVRVNNELALIKRDLQIAHDIQNTVLLQKLPEIAGIEIALRYTPMTELGGDFYDVRQIGEKRFGVLIADVSGHGIPAAFICAMLKVASSFHAADAGDPSLYLGRLNAAMFPYCGGQFITACYAFVDLEGMTVTHANAGHWPLILHSRGTDALRNELDNGVPIGWTADEEYRSLTYGLKPGDRIVLYTDGILEAKDAGGSMYGDERLHDAIRRGASAGAADLADRILEEVHAWSSQEHDRGMDDDITLIVVDIA